MFTLTVKNTNILLQYENRSHQIHWKIKLNKFEKKSSKRFCYKKNINRFCCRSEKSKRNNYSFTSVNARNDRYNRSNFTQNVTPINKKETLEYGISRYREGLQILSIRGMVTILV